ncbi:MAG: PhzF family phenazine biosynthesis protein [Phormidesmis sp.]
MTSGTLSRLSAFTLDPAGGNPAGVWIGEALPAPDEMQRIAAEVGFSETAFVAPRVGRDRTIRYYSPEGEVSFCGHATIATGVKLGETDGDGTYELSTTVGRVPVTTKTENGLRTASLTSVEPHYSLAADNVVAEVLSSLHWQASELDTSILPAIAYAGAYHLVLAVTKETRLASLDYDIDRLKALMLNHNLTTLQLIWQESDHLFHSRNPFPVGGVVEDPATGAAAAALGGYLREDNIVPTPTTFLIKQGDAMGRPSRITVTVPKMGGIVVTGNAVRI